MACWFFACLSGGVGALCGRRFVGVVLFEGGGGRGRSLVMVASVCGRCASWVRMVGAARRVLVWVGGGLCVVGGLGEGGGWEGWVFLV